jgi:ketoreductase RED2
MRTSRRDSSVDFGRERTDAACLGLPLRSHPLLLLPARLQPSHAAGPVIAVTGAGPAMAGKVVLITGSTSGIGAATARIFAAAGCHLVLNSRSSVSAGGQLVTELPAARYVQGDVADPEDCQRMAEAALETWGRLDVVVNNAATTTFVAHDDLRAATPEIWRRIFDVNVLGAWNVISASVEALRRSEGAIINITSVAGSRPGGSSIPYAVSKAALNHLTALLALTLGPEITVNAVAPGLIDTPWTFGLDDARDVVEQIAPLRRIGTAEDVAQVCLAVAQMRYTTGEVFLVDGGMHLT